MPAGDEAELSASEEWTQKPSPQDGEGDSIQRRQKPAGTVQVCDALPVDTSHLMSNSPLIVVCPNIYCWASDKDAGDQDGCSRRHKDEATPQGRMGLLHWRDMPPHLQFNPYVLGGYRPLLSFWGSLGSLFYIHNETINILTHGIPILYILITVPRMLPWERLDSWFLPWCHVVGAVSPWVGSFLYHLFMNTRCGEPVYRRLLQLDMLGIWISQSFGAMPMVSASVYCLPWSWRSTLLSAYSILSLWGLYKALTAWSPWERRLCFALPFCMRAFLCCLRSSGMGGGDPAAMMHVILQDAVSAIGGAIGAMHVPEKWMPGRVDLILNSHNIMHLLVVSAVYCMHHATVRDLLWMASPSPCASRAAQVAASLTKAAAEHLTAGAGEAIGHAASEL